MSVAPRLPESENGLKVLSEGKPGPWILAVVCFGIFAFTVYMTAVYIVEKVPDDPKSPCVEKMAHFQCSHPKHRMNRINLGGDMECLCGLESP